MANKKIACNAKEYISQYDLKWQLANKPGNMYTPKL